MKKSKVTKNFIYNLIYHIFLIIVPLITTPFVSRRLGATGIGDYAYAYSIANYFSLFIKLGLNNYGNRAIAYSRDDKQRMSAEFWNIYCFQFFTAVVVIAIYLLYCFLFASNQQLSIYLVLFVISSGIDITWFFWGMEEFKTTVTRSIIIKILATVAIFIFIKDEHDVGIYTLILSAGFWGNQLFLWPSLAKYVSFVKPTWKEVRKHIKPNLLLFLPAIAVSFYKIMDKIMLGFMSSTTEVGFYESSEKIINIPMAAIESLGTVMQPRTSNLISNNADENYLSSILKKSIILIMFISTAVGFGIMALANEFVPFFYGSGFDKCIILFKILLPSCMFLAFTNVFKTQHLLPRKKDKEYIIALFTGAAVNFTVNALLIPHIASVGAALGTLLAEASVCIVIAIIVKRDMRIFEYYSLSIPFVIAGFIMFVVGNMLHFNDLSIYLELIIKIVICCVIYFAVLMVELLISKYLLKNSVYYMLKSIIQDIRKRKR